MSKAPRWSVDQLDEFRARQHRDDMRHARPTPPIAGEANAQDIPVLTDVVVPGKRKRTPAKTSRPEQIPYFTQLCQLLPPGIPRPVPEYRFDRARRWRLDFAWPRPPGIGGGIAIEIDGGLFLNGAHNRGAALLKQYEKANQAALMGWIVLRYGTSRDQLVQAARDVAKAFGR